MFVYEEMLGGNLAKNYPVIDKFVKGVGTSIKTLDVTAKTYTANAKTIYSKLAKYVDDLHNFQGALVKGVNTTGDAIKKKVLEVGIPRGATTEQVEQISKAIEYAASKGIEMNVRIVK